MRLKILGSGDAFGSGGRFNTCFLVERAGADFLIDCGASAMIAIRRFGVDPNHIGAIFLTHLHADHFGGVPFFVLDAQHISRRREPLVLVGPKGLVPRLTAFMEAGFPGSSTSEWNFRLETIEIEPGERTPVEAVDAAVTGFPVRHPSGAPSMGLRFECEGKALAYTGDTEWVDAIVDIGRGADILLAEASTYERKVPYHLDFSTLRDRLGLIGAKRVVLTHMSADMLSRDPETFAGCEPAHDGLVIDIG
ncbi:MAG TPA: MBL fold metallo-hydrolase [Roseiarcus sp.]|jgi:ribonuclease BN (tRNA processing enzyme)|nr:MBL fold metallo-hydrolase [Roseiarcus sp.]